MVFYGGGAGGGGGSLSPEQEATINNAAKWEIYTSDPTGLAVPTGKLRAIFGDKTYYNNGGVWAEFIDQQGVGPVIEQAAGIALQQPSGSIHTQPYLIDSTGSPDGTEGGQSYKDQPISAPTSPGKWLWITLKGPNSLRFIGTVSGVTNEFVHNGPGKTVKLFSGDGSTWTHYL